MSAGHRHGGRIKAESRPNYCASYALQVGGTDRARILAAMAGQPAAEILPLKRGA
jgi:hypothetical protein